MTLFLLSNWSKSSIVVEEKTFYEYQTLHYNPTTKESLIGSTTIPTYLEPNEFLSFQHVEEWQELISNFGDTEYVCTSVCFCDDDDNRIERKRRSARISGRNIITTLVVALSSYLAIETAKTPLRDNCVKELSDSCTQESKIISSDVNCKQKTNHYKEKDEIEDEEGGSLPPTEENLKGIYSCTGYCLPHDREPTLGTKEYTPEYKAKLEIVCGRKMLQSHRLEFDNKRHRLPLEGFTDQENNNNNMNVAEVVTLYFAQHTLDPFCRSSSMEFANLLKSKRIVSRKLLVIAEKNKHLSMCYGYQLNGQEKVINKKTRCKRLGPLKED